MLGNLGRLLATSTTTRKLACQQVMQATKRFASTSSTIAQTNQQVVLDRALFQYTRKFDSCHLLT